MGWKEGDKQNTNITLQNMKMEFSVVVVVNRWGDLLKTVNHPTEMLK